MHELAVRHLPNLLLLALFAALLHSSSKQFPLPSAGARLLGTLGQKHCSLSLSPPTYGRHCLPPDGAVVHIQVDISYPVAWDEEVSGFVCVSE